MHFIHLLCWLSSKRTNDMKVGIHVNDSQNQVEVINLGEMNAEINFKMPAQILQLSIQPSLRTEAAVHFGYFCFQDEIPAGMFE